MKYILHQALWNNVTKNHNKFYINFYKGKNVHETIFISKIQIIVRSICVTYTEYHFNGDNIISTGII